MRRIVTAAVVLQLTVMAGIFVLAFTLPPERVWIVGPVIAGTVVCGLLTAFFFAHRSFKRLMAGAFDEASSPAFAGGGFRPGRGASGGSTSDRTGWMFEGAEHGGPGSHGYGHGHGHGCDDRHHAHDGDHGHHGSDSSSSSSSSSSDCSSSSSSSSSSDSGSSSW